MDDKKCLETVLNLEKGACDLYLHGSMESSSTNVHNTFSSALNDSITMQNQLSGKMTQKGWYSPEPADQNKINQLKQQFSSGT